ncbi:hypothetical protein BpHYR1_033403 [Brachionus plicatilis]|uniref:Uncharacterized protein n=1 Tax=Brachionus plicatilis TaxID=10195 RepID=A0A3M7PUP6_BRAPC|nr:hypothetical protein BpHYR1_033403 [Brachionus plicatilis]
MSLIFKNKFYGNFKKFKTKINLIYQCEWETTWLFFPLANALSIWNGISY